MGAVAERRFGCDEHSNARTHIWRRNLRDICTKEMVDFMRVLIRYQTQVQLGYSVCRDGCLDARSLITAANATDGQGRANCRPLIQAIVTLAPRLCRTGIPQYLCVGRADLSHVEPLPCIPLSNAIIEA